MSYLKIFSFVITPFYNQHDLPRQVVLLRKSIKYSLNTAPSTRPSTVDLPVILLTEPSVFASGYIPLPILYLPPSARRMGYGHTFVLS